MARQRPYSAPAEHVAPVPHRDGSMDYTYSTSRSPYKMMSATVGGSVLGDPGRLQVGEFGHTSARPKSAQVNAAAWKAYGSPSARGMARPATASSLPAASTNNYFLVGRVPSVARLGGGFRYPVRPMTAGPTFGSSGSPKSPTSPQKRRSMSPQSAGHVPAPPPMLKPGQVLGGHVEHHEGTSFHYTLPTDPAAKRVWVQLTSKAGLGAASGGGSRQLQSARGGSRRSGEGSPSRSRPHSARSSRTERFSSSYIFQLQHAQKPQAVPGFTQPEAFLEVPDPNDSRWTYSRLGHSALVRLQGQIKMAEVPSPSTSLKRHHHVRASAEAPPIEQAPEMMVAEGHALHPLPLNELLHEAEHSHEHDKGSVATPAFMATQGTVLDAVSEADEDEAMDVSPIDMAQAADAPLDTPVSGSGRAGLAEVPAMQYALDDAPGEETGTQPQVTDEFLQDEAEPDFDEQHQQEQPGVPGFSGEPDAAAHCVMDQRADEPNDNAEPPTTSADMPASTPEPLEASIDGPLAGGASPSVSLAHPPQDALDGLSSGSVLLEGSGPALTSVSGDGGQQEMQVHLLAVQAAVASTGSRRYADVDHGAGDLSSQAAGGAPVEQPSAS